MPQTEVVMGAAPSIEHFANAALRGGGENGPHKTPSKPLLRNCPESGAECVGAMAIHARSRVGYVPTRVAQHAEPAQLGISDVQKQLIWQNFPLFVKDIFDKTATGREHVSLLELRVAAYRDQVWRASSPTRWSSARA